MADLKPSTVAPGGGRLHSGEGMPLERRMIETKWKWGVLLRKGPLASVGPKHRTRLAHHTTHGAILKRDHPRRRAGVPESMYGKWDPGRGGCSQSQLHWPNSPEMQPACQGSPSQAQVLHFPERPSETAKTGVIGIIWSVGVQQSPTLSI